MPPAAPPTRSSEWLSSRPPAGWSLRAARYSAASLRERIYSKNPDEDGGPMAGILIYTAAPDSEGTLGGLVRLGEPQGLGRHIRCALEAMTLCASDPLC